MKKILFYAGVIALTAALAACEKKDEPQPKFKIVELPFSSYSSQCATIEDVQKAFTNGADSVYLVSKNDFTEQGSGSMNFDANNAQDLVNVNPPRTKGKGEINCRIINIADSTTLANIGFQVRAVSVVY